MTNHRIKDLFIHLHLVFLYFPSFTLRGWRHTPVTRHTLFLTTHNKNLSLNSFFFFLHTCNHAQQHHLLHWCPPPTLSSHTWCLHPAPLPLQLLVANLQSFNWCCLAASTLLHPRCCPRAPPPPSTPPSLPPQSVTGGLPAGWMAHRAEAMKKTCYTSMHRDRVYMPWDGALPMLRHGPLQLKVIAFPVSPPLFFFLLPPPPLPRFVLFTKRRASLLPWAAPYSLLAFCRPPSLCLTLAFSCLRWNLLLEMAVVQRLLTALRARECEHVCAYEWEGWESPSVWGRGEAGRDAGTLQLFELGKVVHAGTGMLSILQTMKLNFCQ